MATKDAMLVDVVVTVQVADREPRSRVSEARLEEEAVSVVADCLSKERALDVQQVSLMSFEHCQWVFEDGMPVDCGLSQPVRLFADGSWCYPLRGEQERSGRDFRSLVEFIRQQAAM